MQNKSRARTDVQWILSSLSLAVTLGLWGMFASGAKKGAAVSAQVTLVSPPNQVILTQPQAQTLLPGQVLLLGGTAPQSPTTTTQTVVTSQPRHHGGGGGGGGAPAASTGSSHP